MDQAQLEAAQAQLKIRLTDDVLVPGQWRIVYPTRAGGDAVAVFSGPGAEQRARRYLDIAFLIAERPDLQDSARLNFLDRNSRACDMLTADKLGLYTSQGMPLREAIDRIIAEKVEAGTL